MFILRRYKDRGCLGNTSGWQFPQAGSGRALGASSNRLSRACQVFTIFLAWHLFAVGNLCGQTSGPEVLLEDYRQLFLSDPIRAMEDGPQVLAKLNASEEPEIYVRVAFSYIRALGWMGYRELGKPLVDAVVEVARDSGNAALLGYALEQKALFLTREGAYEEAFALVEKASAAYEADEVDPGKVPEDPEAKARNLYTRSVILWKTGELSEALDNALQASRMANDNPGAVSPELRADIFNVLGIIFMKTESFDNAWANFQNALGLFTQIGYRVGEAAALSNLGEIRTRQDRPSEALPFHQRSLALERQIGNQGGIAYSLNLIAQTLAKLGRHAEMLPLLEEALDLHIALGDRYGQAYDWYRIGHAYEALGNLSAAREAYLHTLEICRAAGIKEYEARSLRQLSAIAEASQEFAESLSLHKAWVTVQNELDGLQMQERLAALQVAYETREREQEARFWQQRADLNQNLLEVQKERQLMAFAALLVALLLIALILLLYMQKRKVNRILGERHEALAKAHHRLELLDRDKSDFLSLAAHDIYSPISSIVTTAERMRSGALTPDTACEAVHGNALRVLHLVRSLLDIEALEGGTIGRRRSRFNAAEVLRQAIERHRPACEEAGLSLQLGECPASLTTETDRDALEQILENLLDNARKYCHDGGQIVASLEASASEGFVFRISNPADPIDPAMARFLFEKHARRGRLNARSERSHGIGLYGVRLLCERMGGRISLHSAPGAPVCFAVSLPN